MLHISSSELTRLLTGHLYPFASLSLFSLPRQLLANTVLSVSESASLFQVPHICDTMHLPFSKLCLVSFT